MPKTRDPLERLVAITWHDSYGMHQRWEHFDEAYGPEPPDHVVHSVGYVLRESRTLLHIAPHVHRDEDGAVQFCGDIHITKKTIIELWEIS